MRKTMLFAATAAAVCQSAFATATISNVEVVPGAGARAIVSYSLSEDAVVTPRFYANGRWLESAEVTLLSGDICKKVDATSGSQRRSFTWRAMDESAIGLDKTAQYADAKVELTAWAIDAPPDYMVVDLQSTNRDAVRYYATSNDVPGGILDANYKTNKLVLRKIPARAVTWMMGSSSETDGTDSQADETRHAVSFGSDYYIGIYPVTQAQSLLAFGRSVRNTNKFGQGDDAPFRPTCGYGWNEYRGSSATPDSSPAAGSWLASLRSATGVDFDVPTEAQWEFACRAGTETAWTCGSYAIAKASCWHKDNSAVASDENLTQPVGHFAPNGFGLYDVMGNVFELCRDYYGDYPAFGTAFDPLKASPAANFVYRGGSYNSPAVHARSAFRTSFAGNTDSYGAGIRLSCPAVAR